jgi:hypothetical protein
VIVIQPVALVAVQEQPPAVLTVTRPDPPAALIVWFRGEIVNRHGAGA